MIIELHLLQSFPVSNLNRDDVGQPKTATFGGSTRGRISSQCLKRSARQLFTDHGLTDTETGIRTKRLRNEAAALLTKRGRDEQEAAGVVTAGLEQLGFGVDQDKGLTEYLLFVGTTAIEHLAGYCDDRWDTLAAVAAAKDGKKKPAKAKPDKNDLAEAKRMLDATRVADVALFGRMIADNKDFNVDAASQVAHALSTHAVATEFDYYTAVDDLKPEAESGADMIGTVDFNAACYYRYANLDLDRLRQNLAGDDELVARAARAWLGAFIHAVPSGKQNSMAARTMPDTLLGVVRDGGAWNLANAFLKPVTGEDIMAASTASLTQHFQQLRAFYGSSSIRAAVAASVTGQLPDMDGTDTAASIDEFTSRILAAGTTPA
ncbi:CRISPR-associated protein CSE4 [Amycolatopsis mediterranei S699]|uniref:CRISPR-associated protein CSE4 n=2 Tax=Amycolatopsis mediterranei TaxID=33910 RepID=A0A0H3DBA2_AMYMU|nr:type I-E CRISPR-associated protein Cas7/Cse4/CasC [Amycolatopsis mediterranei]ADJ47557.1 CRISPR-associated protein CSE4 [Amycolatopsis mediterranei U32]AEK44431.1 CRISPR-associated protein CSE4 [Amycolatopsis mediterranei S699]AFO79268.1 CRISPR-associated protein CSE4 [Amycolatopsis mediterranei S699]AGT86396.1 CRISPR-associated protein CSE4 [Amycolatopsis mediterranei RB]KDO11548.1 CRISPR-associated protein Cse4 [Amycolatopsis mediterranei]